jgi:predicted dehydrogenase
MKKIGFIDYFIDEWHANAYPQMIKDSRFGDQFEVVLAWQEITVPGKQRIEDWCAERGIAQATSIEQVVEECDCLVVLSPDNAERHEDLADLPLRSGKPVYIDKPTAPSLAAAHRLFAKAVEHDTPMMSSSALRFGSELEAVLRDTLAGRSANMVATQGGGQYHIYAIHQLEMLVMVLGTGARSVMQCGTNSSTVMMMRYDDARRGLMTLSPHLPFRLYAQYAEDQGVLIDAMEGFFPRFIEALLTFFCTGVSPIPITQTLEIAALLEAGAAALTSPNTWVAVPELREVSP